MSNENYLDKVYTVGESDPDQRETSSGDDSDRDQRRGGQEFYDAISDPAALRNAMNPISEQVKSANLTQTQFRRCSLIVKLMSRLELSRTIAKDSKRVKPHRCHQGKCSKTHLQLRWISSWRFAPHF